MSRRLASYVASDVRGDARVKPVAPCPQVTAPGIRRTDRAAQMVRAAVIVALLLAVAYFAWRGVGRALSDSGDLAVGYAAARAFVFGHDPYSVIALKQELIAADGVDVATSGFLDFSRNVYFPTTLPAFVPLTLTTWPLARLLMVAINVAATLVIAFGLVRWLGWRVGATRSMVLIAAVLALGPLHLTLANGQSGAVATAGLVLAMLLERSGRDRAAGVLYGLAIAAKVQLGLPFLAYLVWRRRWRTATVSGLVLGVLTAFAVLRMTIAGVPWLDSWLDNLTSLSGPGGVNDPSELNPERYSLINLQYPLQSLGMSTDAANLITFTLVAAAALAMLWLIRGRDPDRELLALSTVAVLGLLVAYHRYYDAVILVLPIAWSFSVLGTDRWRYGLAVLLLGVDFVAPLLGALRTIQQRQFLPAWLTDSLLWQAGLLGTSHLGPGARGRDPAACGARDFATTPDPRARLGVIHEGIGTLLRRAHGPAGRSRTR